MQSFYFCLSQGGNIIPCKFPDVEISVRPFGSNMEFIEIFPYELINRPYPNWYNIPMFSQTDRNKGFFNNCYIRICIRNLSNAATHNSVYFNFFFMYDTYITCDTGCMTFDKLG